MLYKKIFVGQEIVIQMNGEFCYAVVLEKDTKFVLTANGYMIKENSNTHQQIAVAYNDLRSLFFSPAVIHVSNIVNTIEKFNSAKYDA